MPFFCSCCFLFSPSSGCEESVFTSSDPVTDLKNLLNTAKRHESLPQHRGCADTAENFIVRKEEKNDSVASMISSIHRKVIEENKHALKRIIEFILLCGRQNIPLRGHVEDRSNFFALLHEVAKSNGKLSAWLALSQGTRATYLSPDIQNKLIEIIGLQILSKLVEEFRKENYFIIADECTDAATKEQLSLCVRFITKNGNTVGVREEFIGFRHAKSTKRCCNIRYHCTIP